MGLYLTLSMRPSAEPWRPPQKGSRHVLPGAQELRREDNKGPARGQMNPPGSRSAAGTSGKLIKVPPQEREPALITRQAQRAQSQPAMKELSYLECSSLVSLQGSGRFASKGAGEEERTASYSSAVDFKPEAGPKLAKS